MSCQIPTLRSPAAFFTSDRPIAPVSKTKDNLAIGYLRAFVTLLVLAHHAVLAYIVMAPPPAKSLLAQPRWWKAFPIVDPHKSIAWGLFAGFNDMFFMALMFLLSGLFAWNGLQRKGAAQFAKDRGKRLGVPFLVAGAIVPLVAYYPTYLQTGARGGFIAFLHEWLSLGQWPAGPAWFVWVLLAFDCVIAFVYLKAPRAIEALGNLSCGSAKHPARFFGLLMSVSAAVYIPMALKFGPLEWTEIGPFSFQTSRLFHYFAYFLIGISLGIWTLERGLLASDGKLARRWLRWSILALFVFALAIVTVIATAAHGAARPYIALNGLLFVLSCAASCFALMAIFVRFAKTRRRIFDSLRDNAYGMYLIHYAFVVWLQYALLPTGLPGLVKGLLVTLGTIALSWGATSALRKIPTVGRTI